MAPPPASPRMSGASVWLLVVLTLAFAIGFIDRQVLNLLVEPIKADLGLSDVQISLLQGVAFSGTYILMTPLAGRAVDLLPRKLILSGALMLWGLFTGLCGLARGFPMLFAARAGLGASESALTPTVYSWLGDSFDNRRMSRAFSIVLMGPYLGGGAALLAGGSILGWAERDGAGISAAMGLEPWQVTFVVLSIPSLLCGLLVLTLRERGRGAGGGAAGQRPPMRAVAQTLARHRRFYLAVYFGMAALITSIYAFPAWIPALLIRRFGASVEEVGWNYGLVSLVTGLAGVLLGPLVAGLLERRGYRDANLRFPLLCSLGLVIACAIVYFASSAEMALAGAGLASLFYSAPTPVAAAALQIATPNRMRGVISSLYVVITTIAGLMIAPTLVASITQYVLRDEARVGESLALVCGGAALLAALLMAIGIPAYRRIVAEADAVSTRTA